MICTWHRNNKFGIISQSLEENTSRVNLRVQKVWAQLTNSLTKLDVDVFFAGHHVGHFVGHLVHLYVCHHNVFWQNSHIFPFFLDESVITVIKSSYDSASDLDNNGRVSSVHVESCRAFSIISLTSIGG